MNIQLFLSDQEIELSESIQFPLNKSFTSLQSPTDILVEYSKSVNIPMTKTNNRIFANAYRLDDTIVSGNGANIGLYIDPTKRIPMKLIYNGDIVLDGYAKFVSTTNNGKKGYYTINLFGKLGDIFKEMMNIVTSESLLGDLPSVYCIDYNAFVKDDTSIPIVDRNLVEKSWENDTHNCWTFLNESTQWKFTDVFGLAPSHRGLYPNFKSTMLQVGSNEIIEMKDYIADIWPDNVTNIEDIIGDGFRDYEMNQYRSYMMKPYIYFNQLMRVYAGKCKEITDYEIKLDPKWFNDNNPYWTKMCYMFDYFDEINKKIKRDDERLSLPTKHTTYLSQSSSGLNYQMNMPTTIVDNSYIRTANGVIINPISIEFGCDINQKPQEIQRVITPSGRVQSTTTIVRGVDILGDTTAEVSVNVINKTNNTTKTYSYWTIGSNDENNKPNYIRSTQFLELFTKGGSTTSDSTTFINYTITTPTIEIDGEFNDGIRIEVDVKFRNNKGAYDARRVDTAGNQISAGTQNPALYQLRVFQSTSGQGSTQTSRYTTYYNITGVYSGSKFPMTLGEISVSTFSGGISFSPETIYKKEEPLFNVILQYTKMFGLVWDIDYNNKRINILTRNSFFDNHTIIDWSDKIDISSGYTISQTNIQNKYLDFNYEDIDGYIYKPYKKKYGINIGGKKLNTGYEFNNESKDLFENIQPSSISSRSFISFKSIIDWTGGMILPTEEQRVMIDCDNEDSSSSISMNNWYLRGDNIADDVYITDDSLYMLSTEKICYISDDYASTTPTIATNATQFPIFTTTINADDTKYGLFFNVPNEDYTYDNSIIGVGNNDIYNLFWKSYINELYNVQSKVVTAYVNLSNEDYLNFTFNKFVNIDNQLFIVNKITDFNPSNNQLTKVELIRINDPNNLKNTVFNSLKVMPTSLWMDSMRNDTQHEFTILIQTQNEISKSNITMDANIGRYATVNNPTRINGDIVNVKIVFDVWEVNETGNIYIENSVGQEAIIPVTITTD